MAKPSTAQQAGQGLYQKTLYTCSAHGYKHTTCTDTAIPELWYNRKDRQTQGLYRNNPLALGKGRMRAEKKEPQKLL